MVAPVALRATQDGVLWPRRPLVGAKGLLACLRNLPASSTDRRPTAFRTVAFNATGDTALAGDERGRVFVLFITANRYALIQHLGVPTVAACFSPARRSEALVTCENETIRCLDVQSQALISTLRGHRAPARSVCFQKSGRLALTASADAVILWDTKDWSRYRVLNAGPGVEEAAFVSRGDLVAVLFQDDSIMMWELETLALRYRFSLPEQERPGGLKNVSVTDDCRILVATGQSRFIYVWDFEAQTIIRIIELPPPIEIVVSHAFVPGHESTLSILGNDGNIFFLDVATKKPKITLEVSKHGSKITAFSIEPHGRYLAASTDDGCFLLYDLDIARDTAKRALTFRREQGFFDLDDHLRLRTRSMVVPADDNDNGGVAPEHHHEVPSKSKLIDNIFGSHRGSHKQNADETVKHEAGQDVTRMSPVIHPTRSESCTKLPSRTPRSRTVLSSGAALSDKEIAINRQRLESSLRCHGAYPQKYRLLVWKFLLRLPKNESSFKALLGKGIHPAFIRLHETYPLKNARHFRRLHRVLSAIAFWCPAFGEVSYLPAVVYPFIKIFRENDLAAFEASLCVLLNWCRDFLSSLPYPPVFVLSELENKLESLDPQLHDHFVKHGVNAEVYGWSLLQTVFTEVLSEDEWLCLWDYLFTYPEQPSLLLVAVLAYLSNFRIALLAAQDRYSIEQFFHQQNAIQIQAFLQLLVNLNEKMDISAPSGHHPEEPIKYWPLPKGQYPAFSTYPAFIVDFQISERKRIAIEEAELLQKKRLLEQVNNECEKLKAEHHNWLKQRKILLAAEEKRHSESIANEKHRILSLKTLDYETRKRRLERLSELEFVAQEMLKHTAELFKTEHVRLDNELELAKKRTEFEISSRAQDEELQRMEYETEKRVREIHKQREVEERLQQLRTEFRTRIKESELHNLLMLDSWKREDDAQRRRAQTELERREKLTLLEQEKAVRQDLENKLLEHTLMKEQELLELKRQRQSRMEDQRAQDHLDEEIERRERELSGILDKSASNILKTNQGSSHPTGSLADSSGNSHGLAHDGEAAQTPDLPDDGEKDPTASRDRGDQEFGIAQGENDDQGGITSGVDQEERTQPSGEPGESIDESLKLLENARRRLSSVLGKSLAESSSSESSILSASLTRTKEELSLLERALGDVSSSSSNNSRSSSSSASGASASRRVRTPPRHRNHSNHDQHNVVGRQQQLQLFQGISPIGRSQHTDVTIPALDDLRLHDSLPHAEHKMQDETDVQGPTVAVGVAPRGSSSFQSRVLAHPESDDDDEDLEEEASSLLQRPIEELERELGIRFDDLSEEEKAEEEEEEVSEDDDDEELEDDRVRLLARAKKLLEEEQSLLSASSSGDEGGERATGS